MENYYIILDTKFIFDSWCHVESTSGGLRSIQRWCCQIILGRLQSLRLESRMASTGINSLRMRTITCTNVPLRSSLLKSFKNWVFLILLLSNAA